MGLFSGANGETSGVYTVEKVDGATPKRWLGKDLVRGYDKPIPGSCAIYFPGGIIVSECLVLSLNLR